ncbi:MAG: hypothetical protein NC411_10785 [Bacteroides sp.]|nr:hypothetical protein [Bacteroides sp.]
MIRHIILFTAILLGCTLSINAHTADSDTLKSMPVDTLLNAATAENLSILSTPTSTSITVRNLNNGNETFFYRSGSSKKHRATNTETQINCPDITSVRVTETPEKVVVSFNNSEGSPLSYSFTFDDPDNRTIRTYTGTKGSDFGFTISRRKTTRWDLISDGIGFGWVNPIKTGTDMDVAMGASHEFMWSTIIGLRMTHRAQSLSLGFGIHSQTLTTHGANYFNKEADGRITLRPYEEGQGNHKSQISLFSLQLPLLYGLSFGHKGFCTFKIGPILNFNTGGHLTTKYTYKDSEYKIKTSDIGQRAVTVDVMASFNYRLIGVYARYSPMKRFNSRVDFDFGTFSTGLAIGF